MDQDAEGEEESESVSQPLVVREEREESETCLIHARKIMHILTPLFLPFPFKSSHPLNVKRRNDIQVKSASWISMILPREEKYQRGHEPVTESTLSPIFLSLNTLTRQREREREKDPQLLLMQLIFILLFKLCNVFCCLNIYSEENLINLTETSFEFIKGSDPALFHKTQREGERTSRWLRKKEGNDERCGSLVKASDCSRLTLSIPLSHSLPLSRPLSNYNLRLQLISHHLWPRLALTYNEEQDG